MHVHFTFRTEGTKISQQLLRSKIAHFFFFYGESFDSKVGYRMCCCWTPHPYHLPHYMKASSTLKNMYPSPFIC
jgi:hypothetical protein